MSNDLLVEPKKTKAEPFERSLSLLKKSNKSTAFLPGRFAPVHKGHMRIIKELADNFDKVVIGIGSCYESGTERHPLLAVFREKMILSSARYENIDESKIDIVHLQDFETFEEWLHHIMKIAFTKDVTHFVTGNKKDILDVLEDKQIKMPFEIINPEDTSNFEYHATDLRNAIDRGDYETFKKIAAFGTVQLMGSIDGFEGIKRAIRNNGTQYVPGRQAVDIVLTMTNETEHCGEKNSTTYLLCGKRLDTKKDFPGYLAIPGGGIDDYESPINAGLRELEEETGIQAKLLDNTIEPAHILVRADNKEIITTLRVLKLFSSQDQLLAGTRGGSSLAMHIHLNEDPNIFKNTIKSLSDLREVGLYPTLFARDKGLAYQQDEMVDLAVKQIY